VKPRRRKGKVTGARYRPPPFKQVFDFIAHEGMAYGVRHAGYLKARELTIIVALTIRKEQDERRMRPGRADLTVPLVRDMIRGLIVSDWKKWRRPRGVSVPGNTFVLGAKELDTTPEEMRGQAVGANWLLRSILAGTELPDIPEEGGIPALAGKDPEIALITDYLYLGLSDLEAQRLEHRLVDDADFFEKVWPLVRVNELGLNLYSFIDDEGNLVALPEMKDEKSPLFAFDAGSWWVEYPISKNELATMEGIFEELRVKILGEKPPN
jgi:hypothetical protein